MKIESVKFDKIGEVGDWIVTISGKLKLGEEIHMWEQIKHHIDLFCFMLRLKFGRGDPSRIMAETEDFKFLSIRDVIDKQKEKFCKQIDELIEIAKEENEK